MKRSAPVILAVTMLVGLAGGLLYTWMLDPIDSYASKPDALRAQDKFVYAVIIGDLYAYEGDLPRAEVRLEELGVEADGQVLQPGPARRGIGCQRWCPIGLCF